MSLCGMSAPFTAKSGYGRGSRACRPCRRSSPAPAAGAGPAPRCWPRCSSGLRQRPAEPAAGRRAFQTERADVDLLSRNQSSLTPLIALLCDPFECGDSSVTACRIATTRPRVSGACNFSSTIQLEVDKRTKCRHNRLVYK